MIKVKYERYWNDSIRKNAENVFPSFADLEEWMFGQMEQDYTHDAYVMSIPTPEKVKRIRAEGPWRIQLIPKHGEETIWIHQIESDQGIIFSDGTFTSRQTHWSEHVKAWLTHCEERRKAPRFNFAENGSVESMFNVFAYDKDSDIEVLLAQMTSYDHALVAARCYVPLVTSELIRNNHGALDSKGEPFDWVAIRKPDGTSEVITEVREGI